MKSTTQSGLWNITFGELGATLKALQDHGVTLEHLARLRAEPDYAKRVAEFMGSPVEGTEVTSTPPVAASSFFANEEVESNYGYPEEYAVKPVYKQLAEFSTRFTGLDTSLTLAYSKKLPPLPAGAEGWFAVPRWERLASSYNEAVQEVLDLIGRTRPSFSSYFSRDVDPNYLRLSERTALALEIIREKQKGDFLLIPAQFGRAHRGRSVRKVRMVYAPHEFGLGSFIVGCMLLSHPERLVRQEQLHINCPGDECSPHANSRFSSAPLFRSDVDGGVEFGINFVSCPSAHYGSASGFIPQWPE
jgi:hypothetical protein